MSLVPPDGLDDDGLRAWAHDQLRRGSSQREVARAVGVGKTTVARWVASERARRAEAPTLPAVVSMADEDRALELVYAAMGRGWDAGTARRLAVALGLPVDRVEQLRGRVLADTVRWISDTPDGAKRASVLLRIRWWGSMAVREVDACLRRGAPSAPALGQLGRALSAEARLLGLDAEARLRLEGGFALGVEEPWDVAAIRTPEHVVTQLAERVPVAALEAALEAALALTR